MKKLLFCFLLFGSNFLNAQRWYPLSSGLTNGINRATILALTQFNDNLITGGSFDSAGKIYTSNIAQWDGIKWDSLNLAKYVEGVVYAQCVYKDSLIVARENGPNYEITEWNGTTWESLNPTEYKSIAIHVIDAFITYQGSLYVCGQIGENSNSTSNIAIWNGNNWDTLSAGVTKKDAFPYINTMTVYNGNLYIGGNFDTTGNIPAKNIAMWNGSTWSAVGDGFNGSIHNLFAYNGTLYAAGSFDSSGSQAINCIASWDGIKWKSLGRGIRGGQINSLVTYGSILCVGGSFDSAGDQKTNNIAYWDGSNWYALGSGITNGAVFCLSVYNGALVAAGTFDTAGGIPANSIAQWISPLGINDIANKDIKVNVYPNPNSGQFTLSLSNVNTGCSVEIYNVLGEKVYSEVLPKNQNSINLTGQPNGVYLYRVITENGELMGKGKIVIQ